MKTRYISILLTSILFLVSCTKVIDVVVPDGGARLVVEASINWEKGTTGQNQIIRLTTSTAYFDSNPAVPVIGAVVKITKDNDGTEFVFQDQGDGNYRVTDFEPELNQQYSLEIIYNGETYVATETLTPVVAINDIEQATTQSGTSEEISVTIFFDDPANERNFYLGEFFSSIDPLLSLDPLNDSFTDGNQNFMEYENADLVAGNTVSISLYGISEQYYNFINLLSSQAGGGGMFATVPAQLKGNCKNITNPNEEVLGYFRLSEVVKTTYTIN